MRPVRGTTNQHLVIPEFNNSSLKSKLISAAIILNPGLCFNECLTEPQQDVFQIVQQAHKRN